MKGKGILDKKGTDKTVRKQERKKATFHCSFVSLNRIYVVALQKRAHSKTSIVKIQRSEK